jgi:hypothetical protein
MNTRAVTALLPRFLVTLGGLFVWKKALADGRGDDEKPSTSDDDKKIGGWTTAKDQK